MCSLIRHDAKTAIWVAGWHARMPWRAERQRTRHGNPRDCSRRMSVFESRGSSVMGISGCGIISNDRRGCTAISTADDPRWGRVAARDRTADGVFWYSVTTTGVYCRPSCPSRTANVRNVRLHGTLREARATGFRPCKRCDPNGLSREAKNSEIVVNACRLIEQSEQFPSLTDLANSVELSPGYFHHMFKAMTGLTPKAYAAAHQANRVRAEVCQGKTVTQAIYDSGFSSNGRFYEKSMGILGMTPTRYRAGGSDEVIRFAMARCSLGTILVASSKEGASSILIGDNPEALIHDLRNRFSSAHFIGADDDYELLVARVVGLVEAPGLGRELPLDVRRTAFQRRVWQALREIPAARKVAYTSIALKIGPTRPVHGIAGDRVANDINGIKVRSRAGGWCWPSGYRWGIERGAFQAGPEHPGSGS
jgi:AraC family transcriptional regulator, regulatory protein of adaptative response / methylated-DNA-[protein]-cysteine methyltransferase